MRMGWCQIWTWDEPHSSVVLGAGLMTEINRCSRLLISVIPFISSQASLFLDHDADMLMMSPLLPSMYCIPVCTTLQYVDSFSKCDSTVRQSTHDVSAEHWTLTLQTLDTGPCEPQPGWAGDRALELDPAQPSSRATSRASQPSSWNEELNS